MNFKRYHVSKNLLSEKYENRSINGVGAFTIDSNYDLWIGEVVAGQTYAISNMNYVYGFFTAKPLPNTGATYDGSRGYEMSGTAVVTVPSGCTWIAVRVLHNADNAMCNTGSQPLPYEPYDSEVWHDIPHYIHNTSTDTLTTLPADIYANDTTATVGLKGQAVQSSTPSPTSPVMPQGCGDKTANLWNEEGFSARAITSTHEHTDTNTYGTTLSTTIGKETIITQSEYPTGTVGYQNGFFFIDVDFSKYEIGDKVTLSFDYICNEVHSIEGQVSTTLYAGKNSNSIPVVLSSGKWSVSGRLTAVITVIADMNPYVEVRLCGNSITVKNIMLNSGSQPLPYEPFGVKIPILSASTTTPVYLGEMESTRQIRELVLTGQEEFVAVGDGNIFRLSFEGYLRNSNNIIVCTHYLGEAPVEGYAQLHNLCVAFLLSSSGSNFLYIRDDNYTSASTFKTYLQQQYANGTPVTIWYVLAEPTTGIVNEPIRKIGDYADTVSGITIPTIAGANSFDVLTTLQPSEVTVNYKGWHPVSAVHERESGAWT